MRPGARVGAVIEILEELGKTGAPADRVLTGYTRNRRYIGSKDRREIGNLVFSVLRARLRLIWWLERKGHPDGSPRAEVLAALCLVKALPKEEIAQLFAGEGYGPSVLTPDEENLIAALSGAQLDDPEQPAWVRDEVEPWLHERLVARFGEDMAAEMAAMKQEADVILRVNRLKAARDEASAALAEDEVVTRHSGMSPLGLRIEGRRNLQASRAFREGLVEVQDEGSQLIALLCEAEPDMAVADYCAGAGGKTLALAAEMRGQGRLVALDTDAKRLQRAHPRLARAGAGFVEQRSLPDDGWMAENAEAFDRVLVDAPCSGSGVWRRQPDARLALTPERLADYLKAQSEVLQRASFLVRPGGRLIYATCSFLPEEDEQQVERFLAENRGFRQKPIAGVWKEVLPGVDCPSNEPHLLLTPRQQGTDGFFVAVLERLIEDV